MFRPPGRDDVLDAIALIQAAHDCDPEAAMCILDNCDRLEVIAVLAVIARDLLTDLGAMVDEPRGDLLAELRPRHAATWEDG